MTLEQRHNKAHKDLIKAAKPHMDKKNVKALFNPIAKKYKISDQTIYNYIGGRCKDGFLTEALTFEFKQLKNN